MDHPNLTKVCMLCGEQKPLTAFVQLTDAQGGLYGSICSGCQKLEAEKAKIPAKDMEDDTTSSTRFQIDSKSRVQEQTDKRQHNQHIQELEHEHRKKQDEHRLAKLQKTERTVEDEKRHREHILKTNLFSDKKRENLEKATAIHQQTQERVKETHNRSQAAFEEKKRTTVDFTVPQIDSKEGSDSRYQNATFQTFRNWLGSGTPIGQALTKIQSRSPAAIATPADPEKDKSASVEFIEKNWGPSSRRR